VEIIQNCIVYNDGAFDSFAEKAVKDEHQLELVHGKPMLFARGTKGIRFNPKAMALEVATIGENGITEADILVHDETNRMLGVMLCQLEPPEFPVPIGVLHCAPAEKSYEEGVWAQIEAAKKRLAGKPADLDAMLRKGATWTVAA
jgi:2-oxoglutarate ferredoxin oxidoreductase subunit beta